MARQESFCNLLAGLPYDAVTGVIPVRFLVRQAFNLQQSTRREREGRVLILSLDRFKDSKDSQMHDTATESLRGEGYLG